MLPYATADKGAAYTSPDKGAVNGGGFNVNSLVQNNQPLGGVYSQGFNSGNPANPNPTVPGDTPMQNPNGTAFDADNNGNPTGPYVNPSAGASGYNNPFGTSAWRPQYENFSGYNPYQYANNNTANNLAQALGGRVMQTRYDQASPFGVPPQSMIDFGGADMLNAGLLADRYAKYDRATADAMTRAELAQMGPRQDPNGDSQGGSMGSWSQYANRDGGQDYLGQGANMGQFIGNGQGPQNPGGGGNSPMQYQNQIFNTNQTPGGYLRGGSPRPPQLPRYGGFGQASQFGAQNPFFSRPGQFNAGLMGSLMGQPSLLSRMNQVSGFGGQGGPFGMGGQYGSFGGGDYGRGTMGGFGGFLNQLFSSMNQNNNPWGGGSYRSSYIPGPWDQMNSIQPYRPGQGGGGMSYTMGGPSGGYDAAGNFLG